MKKGNKSKKYTSPTPANKPEAKAKSPISAQKWTGFAVIGVFVVFSFVLLALCYGDYMHKVEALSLFLSTQSFLSHCMDVPGGAILWCAAFLNQFFYFPWLGALIYSLLLGAIAVVIIYAFRIPRSWTPLAVVPCALVLLAFTNLGYLIFSLKPVGFSYTLPLGILSALLLFWGYGCLGRWWLRVPAIVFIVCCGYPLLGFFALFGAVLCAVSTLLPHKSESYWLRLLPAAVCAVCVLLMPRLWFFYIDSDLIYSQMYICPLPRFYAAETGWRVLYIVIFSIFLVLGVFTGRFPADIKPKLRWLPLSAAAASVLCILVFRYNDKNFRLTLSLDRALWEQRWADAESLALSFDSDLTRVNTVLSYIAMMRNGDAGQCMFSIIDAKAPYATSRSVSAFNDAVGPLVAYQLGLINYAYRWATEYTIGQGESVERLKIMVKCALLNYELNLARNYINILYNMPLHRDWAKKYMRFVNNPIEMASDPELLAIAQLMCHHNEFINDGGAFESYVWPLLANAQKGTEPFNELSMQGALVSRDLDNFIAKLPDYAHSHQRIPRYYQEAALLWSLLSKQPCPINIDPDIEDKHNRFLNAFRNSSQMEAELQKESMRNGFADTYWFYFVFNDDMLLK